MCAAFLLSALLCPLVIQKASAMASRKTGRKVIFWANTKAQRSFYMGVMAFLITFSTRKCVQASLYWPQLSVEQVLYNAEFKTVNNRLGNGTTKNAEHSQIKTKARFTSSSNLKLSKVKSRFRKSVRVYSPAKSTSVSSSEPSVLQILPKSSLAL